MLNSKAPSKGETNAFKPILSMDDLMQLLDCSRSNIYNLIDEEIIIPHYFPNQKRRPYFLTDQVIGALQPQKKEA